MPVVFAVGPLCGTRRRPPRASRSSPAPRSPGPSTTAPRAAGSRGACGRRDSSRSSSRGKAPARSPSPSRPPGRSCCPPKASGRRAWGDGSRLVGPRKRRRHRPRGGKRGPLSNVMMGEGNAVGRGGLGAVLGRKEPQGRYGGRRSPGAGGRQGTVRPRPRGRPATLPGLARDLRGARDLRVRDPRAGRPHAPAADGPHGELPSHRVRRFPRLLRPDDPRRVRREEGGLFRLPHPLQEAGVRRTLLARV